MSELFIISLEHTLKYHSLLTLPLLFIKRATLLEQSATSQSKQWYVDNGLLAGEEKWISSGGCLDKAN